MDDHLQLLWENYRLTQSPQDLDRFNLACREAKIDLFREDNFIRDWSRNLATQLGHRKPCANKYSSIERRKLINFASNAVLNPSEARSRCAFRVFNLVIIINQNISFCLFNGFCEDPEKLRICLMIPGPENLPPICSLIADIEEDVIHLKDAQTPWSVEQENNFINEEELINFLINKMTELTKEYYQERIEKLKSEPTISEFKLFLNISEHINVNHFKNNHTIFKFIFLQSWFQDILRNYAEKAEKYCASQDVRYDLEQIWPTKIIASDAADGHGFSLIIRTGYNDELLENSDEDDYGKNRGHAGYEADQFADLLDHFDNVSEIDGDSQLWSGDYEIEEIDRENLEVSFEIKAERHLTLKYLKNLITKFMVY